MEETSYEVGRATMHDKALSVCELFAEGTPLDKCCSLEDVTISQFFATKRDNPDVQKAFLEAKEVNAELRLCRMDGLKAELLAGAIDKDVFKAAIQMDQWVITKLRPDLFGTRTTVSVSGTIEHSAAKALERMTDEQILRLAALPVEEAEYEEVQGAQVLAETQECPILADDSAQALHNEGVDKGVKSDYSENEVQGNENSGVHYLQPEIHNVSTGGESAGSGTASSASLCPTPRALDLSLFGGE